MPEHGHDFSESVWVESGSGIHVVAATRESVRRGWVRLVEPTDVHRIRGCWTESLCIANVAFRTDELVPLHARFDRATGYQALDMLRPGNLILPDPVLQTLQRATAMLALSCAASRDLLRLLTALLADIESETAGWDVPAWLKRARSLMEHHEDLLAGGLATLCQIAERTPDHINRTIRRNYGTTTNRHHTPRLP